MDVYANYINVFCLKTLDTVSIVVDNISFGYGKELILENLSQTFEDGKFYAILGPNGVGKSTFIRCINKILKCSEGSISIDGRDVNDIDLKEMAKIIGYVPYSSGDSFSLSVVDTVLMGRHPHSKFGSLVTDLKKVHEVLEQLEITDLALREVNSLSAGQRQKVMLARGLVQDPKVLLLDEPTSNLDVRHQLEVTKILDDLCREKGITVIMICHDLNIAAKYADELILMYDKKVFSRGTPSEVLTADNLKTVYGVETTVLEHNERPCVILDDFIKQR